MMTQSVVEQNQSNPVSLFDIINRNLLWSRIDRRNRRCGLRELSFLQWLVLVFLRLLHYLCLTEVHFLAAVFIQTIISTFNAYIITFTSWNTLYKLERMTLLSLQLIWKRFQQVLVPIFTTTETVTVRQILMYPLGLVLVLHFSGGESGANLPYQSQCKVKQNQGNLGSLSVINWNLLW